MPMKRPNCMVDSCGGPTRRPRVTAKWAMTLDGYLASHTGHSGWISSPEALAYSRRRRRIFDAIVVGGGTARADDPRLLATARDGRTPRRIVLDDSADCPLDSQLVSTAAQSPVVMVHGAQASAQQLAELAERGVTTIAVADPRNPAVVLQALGDAGCNELLVEGGAACTVLGFGQVSLIASAVSCRSHAWRWLAGGVRRWCGSNRSGRRVGQQR